MALRSALKKLSIAPGALTAEIVPIVFGAVLGVAFSEWRQARAEGIATDRAWRSTAAGMTLDRGRLVGRLARTRRLLTIADSLRLAGAPLDRLAAAPDRRGTRPPLLRSASCAAAQNTGAFAKVDVGTAEAPAKVHALKGRIEDLSAARVATWATRPRLDAEVVLRGVRVFGDFGGDLLRACEGTGSSWMEPRGRDEPQAGTGR